MLNLRTLGTVHLTGEDGEAITSVLSQPKRFALLIYLAVSPPGHFQRRDTLLTLFWPERDDVRGRNALSQSLNHLRRNLPEGVIVNRGTEEVGVSAKSIRVDAVDLLDALGGKRWADALDLYLGDFLPGFHVEGAWGFEDWMAGERERLREAAAGAAWSLAREQIQRGALVEAERTAQRATDLVSTDESPVRDFIRELAKAGDRAAAVNFFERFRARLWEKLEVEPSVATVETAEAIRNGDLDHVPRDSVPQSPTGQPALRSKEPAGSSAPEAGARPGPWKLWFWSLTFAAVVCFAAVGILRVRGSLRALGPPPENRPFTVLAQVGGSATADERECVFFLLQNGLDMSHVVRTVPVIEIERALGFMDRDPATPLEPALAREVAVRLGVGTVVLPRLDRLGGQYVLVLRVEDVRGGLPRADARGAAGNEAEVVAMVDQVTRELRRKLGDTRTVLAAAQSLPQVLTPSLEALERFQEARELGPGQAKAAVSRLREAVALDTAFAMAWQLMAAYYGSYLNQPDSADFARQQVERFRDRLTEARRSDLELHRRIGEDVALWDLALEEAERAVLRDPRYLNNYAVYTAFQGGLPDSALNIRFRLEREAAEDARRLDPSTPFSTRCFINTHYWAAALDRVDEWLSLLDSLQVDLPPDCGREVALFESLAAGEWNRVDSMVQAGPGDWRWPTGVETALLQMVPLRGRIHAAQEGPPLEGMLTRALSPDAGGQPNVSHLVLQLVYGLPLDEASREGLGAGGTPKDLGGRGGDQVIDYVLYGVRQALLGDTLEARRAVGRLQAMRDSATSRAFEASFEPWFILMEAGPAYQRGDWNVLIETLEPMAVRIHDPGVGQLEGDAYIIWWLLAEAHSQSGEPRSAVPFLESILERPRSRVKDWMLQGYIHPAARFKLAGLYQQLGDTERAREHYRIFLDTFTDPDPEFERMVEEARVRSTASGG
jgi:DNA-binding SARP family transcriptional activator/tetratricopeptide (TPR) repeat protein